MEPRLFALARVAAGLTQTQLAKELGKSQPFVSQIEKGERDLPPDLLPQWCRACDIPESFLRSGRLPLDDSVAAMVHRKMKTLPAKPHNLANAQVKMRVLEVDALFAEIDIVPSLEIPSVPLGTRPCRRSRISSPSMAASIRTSAEPCWPCGKRRRSGRSHGLLPPQTVSNSAPG